METAPNSYANPANGAATSSSAAESAPSFHLVLHLDVNKTLLMQDAVSNKTVDMVVNALLADACWGVQRTREDGTRYWQCLSTTPTPCPPPELVASLPPGSVLNYYEYCKEAHSYEGAEDKANVKKQRDALICTFTEKGQPGESMRHHKERLSAALRLPPTYNAEAAAAAGQYTYTHPDTHTYFLMPAFYRLVDWLIERERKTDKNFTIFFRTLGTDTRDIAREINAYIENRHPVFRSQHTLTHAEQEKLRVHVSETQADTLVMGCEEGVGGEGVGVDRCGALFRGEGGEVYLLKNTIDNLSVKEHDILTHIQHTHTQTQASSGSAASPTHTDTRAQSTPIRVCQGMQAIHEQFSAWEKHTHTVALRDHYPPWRDSGEHHSMGKLFLLDPHSPHTLHVFFDDNIIHDDLHIVDPRDATKPDYPRMSHESVFGLHCMKCEPIGVIEDDMYFVKELEECQKKYAEKLRQKGVLPAH